MSFFQSVFRFPSKSDWTSWHALWRPAVLIVAASIFSSNATDTYDAASRQQTSLGVLTGCQDAGKGSRSCSYTFSASGRQYTGASSVGLGAHDTQTMTVFFDSQNPQTNSLDDMYADCRKDRNAAYGFGFVAIALVSIVLYSNLTRHDEPDQRLA